MKLTILISEVEPGAPKCGRCRYWEGSWGDDMAYCNLFRCYLDSEELVISENASAHDPYRTNLCLLAELKPF